MYKTIGINLLLKYCLRKYEENLHFFGDKELRFCEIGQLVNLDYSF